MAWKWQALSVSRNNAFTCFDCLNSTPIFQFIPSSLIQSMPMYVFKPYFPLCLFRVSIVPADSSYSLEKGDDRGAAGHVFRPGDELTSDTNKFPSTASYQDGVIAGTGIRIFDIKEIKQNGRDTIMKFSVLFEGDTMPPSVAPTAFPTIESPEPKLFSREIGKWDTLSFFVGPKEDLANK